MKIIKPISVTVGPYDRDLMRATKRYFVENQSGSIVIVNMPVALVVQFEWIAAKDGLSKLLSLAPDIADNNQAVRQAMFMNTVTPGNSLQPGMQGYTPVPEFEATATWLFKCPDLAMLFKLTFGGDA